MNFFRRRRFQASPFLCFNESALHRVFREKENVMNQHQTVKTGIGAKSRTLKLVMTGMLACLAFVLNTFVYFPSMAPFQHFVDVLAAVFLGPWYGCASALLCGIMRMMSGRTIQAVTGAVFGPVLGGLLYRKTKNIYLVFVGEVIGTGFMGAMASYPLMKMFYGLDAQSPFYYIPFYTPSAVTGAAMGLAVLLMLKKGRLLERMEQELE